MKIFLIAILATSSLFACHSRKDDSMIRIYMQTYKEQLPEKILADSGTHIFYAPALKSEQENSSFKLLNFINTDCGSCFNKMDEWIEFLHKTKLHIKPIFIASGSLNNYFADYIARKKDLPFFIYLENSPESNRAIRLAPYDKESFLVDKNGALLLMGNPVTNSTILNYITQLTDQ